MTDNTMIKPLFRFPMDLQLFAVGPDGLDDADLVDVDDIEADEEIEIDTEDTREIEFDDSDDDADLEEDQDDEQDDQDTDDEDLDTDLDDDKGDKGKNPTAAAVIAERKKWQAKLKSTEQADQLAKKLLKMSGAKTLEELQKRLDAAEASELVRTEKITPEEAQRRIDDTRRTEKLEQDLRKLKYDGEFNTLAKDPVFSGIENAREEVEELAEKAGITLKQAYFSLFGEQRLKDRETEITSRVKSNKDKRQAKKVDTGSTTSNSNPSSAKKLNLTPDQLAAAQYGVKKGHFKSVEEYAKYLK